MQVPEDPLPQPTVWLHQVTTAESLGGAPGERVQVHSSPMSMVLQESSQQRSEQTYSSRARGGSQLIDMYHKLIY